MRLYHYTCIDAAPHIERERWLKGNRHPWLADIGPVVWLTDLAEPDRDALGLSSVTLGCDRTEFRVTAVTDAAEHWPKLARRIPRWAREELELAPGAMPMHWYVVAGEPVPILAIEKVAR